MKKLKDFVAQNDKIIVLTVWPKAQVFKKEHGGSGAIAVDEAATKKAEAEQIAKATSYFLSVVVDCVCFFNIHISYRQALDKAKEILSQANLQNVECVVKLDDDPRSAILEEQKKRQANVIVVGNRGLSKVKYLLLGSLSEYLVEHAPCPVLVFRPTN